MSKGMNIFQQNLPKYIYIICVLQSWKSVQFAQYLQGVKSRLHFSVSNKLCKIKIINPYNKLLAGNCTHLDNKSPAKLSPGPYQADIDRLRPNNTCNRVYLSVMWNCKGPNSRHGILLENSKFLLQTQTIARRGTWCLGYQGPFYCELCFKLPELM